jgi:outer membrane protein assembly factor BamB
MKKRIDDNEVTRSWYKASLIIAVFAFVFSIIASALMVSNFIQLKSSDPLNSPELAELKAQLFRQPADVSLKEQIRTLDLQLRKSYFHHRAFSKFGGYLLIVSIAIFLIGIKLVEFYRSKLPMPITPNNQNTGEYKNIKKTRWVVIIIGLLFINGVVAMVVDSNRGFSKDFLSNAEQIVAEANILQESKQNEIQQASSENTGQQLTGQATTITGAQAINPTSQSAVYPTLEEIKKNWSRFRGPEGLGISYYSNIPSSWNGKTGENIAWKTPIPLPGENSPIIWGKRIFLTGANDKKREVYCFDTDTGKLIWQKPVENIPGSDPQPPKVYDDTGYAAPTATTDGQRFYAIFANGDLVAFDFTGNLVWAKNLGNPKSMYGYASSLLTYKNMLIVLYDQGSVDDNLSKIIAFDSISGSVVWETKRPVPNSWATPIIINTGKREELITSANPYVIAYDPATGSEFWRAKCLTGDIAPSPVYANGFVYATNAYAKLVAIRPDGQGDVTQTNIAWSADSGLPDICSPLTNGDLLFLLQTYGLMTCYDAKTGQIVWDNDFAETFNASPSLVGDKLYLLTADGLMIIIKADRKFEETARHDIGEKTNGTPAFLDGRIYIRGKENLYCIGKR